MNENNLNNVNNNEITDDYTNNNAPNGSRKKVVYAVIILVCIIAIGAILAVVLLNKDNDDDNDSQGEFYKLSDERYQSYVDDYGFEVKFAAENYYLTYGEYPSFDDIKDEISINDEVTCEVNEISSNGNITISKCKIKYYEYNSSIKYEYINTNSSDKQNTLSTVSSLMDDNRISNNIKYIIDEDKYNYKISSFKIADNDVTNYFAKYKLGSYIPGVVSGFSIKEFDDFYVIDIESDSTCGRGDSGIYIFGKDGKLILSKDEKDTIKNDLDSLVYDGSYVGESYSFKNNKLTLRYGLTCDLDCNVCGQFYNDENVCNILKKYADSIVYADYEATYLGNGMFSSFTQTSKTLLKDDLEHFGYNLSKCN